LKHPSVLIAAALVLLTAGLLTYRVRWLGYPVFPTAPGQTWQVSLESRIKTGDRDFSLLVGLPSEKEGRILVEERVSSGRLSFNIVNDGENRIGIWSGAPFPTDEILTYRAILYVQRQRPARLPQPPLSPYPAFVSNEERIVVQRLAAVWTGLTPEARLTAALGSLAGNWGASPPRGADLEKWNGIRERYGNVAAFMTLLRAAQLPARVAEGVPLTAAMRNRLMRWIEVWNGQGWLNLNADTGELYRSNLLLLPLMVGDVPSVRSSGLDLVDAHWVVSRQVLNSWKLHVERITRSSRFLDRWSLFRLPAEFQRTFRYLLLIPIGALLICILRNVIGFPTFGIFMPVLMALAFRSTGLVYGVILFAGVVMIGYAVRRLLDRLHLLLVPRMSVLLTLVIACFTVVALIGNRFHQREFMAVGLLPFVILAMTIERFFVVVEESGVREGMLSSAGSAAVAVITYQIISWEPLQLTFFVYPELIATVAAAQLLLGRYTGYRLSEFIRFRSFRGKE
jgi:hypothetical protein